MERKQFIRDCTWACGATLLIPTLFGSCSSVYQATSVVEGSRIKMKMSEFYTEKGELRKFVVIRNEKLEFPIGVYQKEDLSYTAIYLRCTHRGCEVKPSETILVCPCHGSEFSTEGKVLSPPADLDLTLFNVSTDHESIFIQI